VTLRRHRSSFTNGAGPTGPAPSRHGPSTMRGMDPLPPDPKKLLAFWMEWEKGETPPGRVISNLKTAGLRDLLEQLAGDNS
jgi:hypothetical protein